VRAPSAPPPRGRGELILLVEDSEPLRVLCEHLLVDQDYRVVTAAHPTLAIELAARAGSDLALLLTDAMLPSMTGRELAECVRQRDAQLRVAYMSGHDDQVLARRGAVDAGLLLLQKPFSDRDLLAFVRRALDEPAAAAQHQRTRTV
jgi:DNA-binding response OmpR family regulator